MRKELPTPFTTETLVEGDSSLQYYQFHGMGKPETAFVSGIHGHEFGVIGIARTELDRRTVTGQLKHSHVHISHAHPPAIHAKEKLGNDIDLNRAYPVPAEMPVYPGAKLLRRVADQFPIKYIFSFHEDHEPPGLPFYFYDIPRHLQDTAAEDLVYRLRGDLMRAVHKHGFKTHTGLDDKNDPVLGNWIENGYVQTTASDHYDTTYEVHMTDLGARGMGTVQRAFVFEIPGFVSRAEKKAHVDLILDTFVLPFLEAALPVQ